MAVDWSHTLQRPPSVTNKANTFLLHWPDSCAHSQVISNSGGAERVADNYPRSPAIPHHTQGSSSHYLTGEPTRELRQGQSMDNISPTQGPHTPSQPPTIY